MTREALLHRKGKLEEHARQIAEQQAILLGAIGEVEYWLRRCGEPDEPTGAEGTE